MYREVCTNKHHEILWEIYKPCTNEQEYSYINSNGESKTITATCSELIDYYGMANSISQTGKTCTGILVKQQKK